jgi:MFS family permease
VAVSTALPTIVADLHADEFLWVASAYGLASSAFIPLSGGLAEVFKVLRRDVRFSNINFALVLRRYSVDDLSFSLYCFSLYWEVHLPEQLKICQ